MNEVSKNRTRYEKVTIGKGKLACKGVYASQDIAEGETVIHYNLKPLSEQDYQQLSESEKMFTHIHRGTIYLYSEPERYVNHSDTPNTYQDLDAQRDVALRPIAAGEMITTDSRKDDID